MINIVPYYWIRAVGGLLYLLGFFIFVYNIYKSFGAKALEKEPLSASPAGVKEVANV